MDEGLNGNGLQPAQALGEKPKTTVIKPLSANVVRLPDGTMIVEFELSPYEAISLMLPPESKQALVKALTGGVHVAGPGELLH